MYVSNSTPLYTFFAAILFTIIFTTPIIYQITPLGIVKNGLGMLSTLAHEVGHTLFFWLFGYIALPAFDFNYGGGVTITLSSQSHLIQILLIALCGYGIFLIRDYKRLFFSLLTITTFIFIAGFFEFHKVIYLFMGHGFEALIGSFFLLRALFNIAPRGKAERFLNMTLGIYLNVNLIKDFYLITSDSFKKDLYIHQKGQIHIGDFSVIANDLSVNLDTVCYFGIAFSILCLLAPVALFLHHKMTSFVDEE
jgi:hypothetical protein